MQQEHSPSKKAKLQLQQRTKSSADDSRSAADGSRAIFLNHMRASLPKNQEETLIQNRKPSFGGNQLEQFLQSSSSSGSSDEERSSEEDSCSPLRLRSEDDQRDELYCDYNGFGSGARRELLDVTSKRDSSSDYSSSSDGDQYIDFYNQNQRQVITSSEDYTSEPGYEDREIHMNSQEEDLRQIKHTFQEILTQLKSYGEIRRIKKVKEYAAQVSNGKMDPVVRSMSASIGNHRDEGSDKLHSPYLSLVKDKVFAYRDKYTGMSLMHYACEYGCLRFIKAVCKARGPYALISMICQQSRSGKNGLHFMARNHSTSELNYFFLVTKQLKKFCNQYSNSSSLQEESKDGRATSSTHDSPAELQSIVIQALKTPDLTLERNTVLHTALINEFRFPEELCIDFEENFELSESQYGQKISNRRQFRKFEIEYSSVKRRLKELFILRLVDLLQHEKMTQYAFKQMNSVQFCPLELIQQQNFFSILKKIIKLEPLLINITFGNQNTLLHLCAKQGQTRVVKYLLEKSNIDQNAVNIFQQSAFQLAFNEGNLEVCELLRQSSSDFQLGGFDDSEAFLKHQIYRGQNNEISPLRSEGFTFKDVFVHLDLKGAPPVFDFLMRYLEFLTTRFEFLVTGFVIEFEDMFPYEGHLASVASPKAYSREQIQYLVSFLKGRKLKIVVLVQTFGHLEYVLKRSRFMDYREQPDNPISICSLRKGAIQLIGSLLKQVIDLIGEQNIDLLHIGADEVFNFASCRECSLFVQQANDRVLFARWITKVLKLLNKNYPYLKIMAWDDMYRHWPGVDLMLLRLNNHHTQQQQNRQQTLQPCVWNYCGQKDAFDMTISDSQLHQICLEFKRVWVASAWQGAKEPSASWTDFEQRLHNHRLWLERLQNSVHSQTFQEAIQGIILTGWTRFTHQTVLCELLPMTVPSLACCLMVIENKKFNLEVLYSQLVSTLRLQPKKLLQDIEQVYRSSSLREFVRETPWMKNSKRKAKYQFCNDAFEIAWIINKGLFLIGQVEVTMKDWICIDQEKLIQENVNRNAYPKLMHQELSHLLASFNAKRTQKTQKMPAQNNSAVKKDSNQSGKESEQVDKGHTGYLLKDSDSMELDETSNNNEQQYTDQNQQNLLLLQHQQRSNTQDSLDTAKIGLDKLRGLTSSSEDNVSGILANQSPQFDFDDRVYSTLRTQFYKQLRGCVKLFRKAAILCDKVLPQYLFRADIEEFRNTKIMPHLLKAYSLQMSLFSLNRPLITVKKETYSENDGKLNLGLSPWAHLASNFQNPNCPQKEQRKLFIEPTYRQQAKRHFHSGINVDETSFNLRLCASNAKKENKDGITPASNAKQAQATLHQRGRSCQTPDQRHLNGSPLLVQQKLTDAGEENLDAGEEKQIIFDHLPLRASQSCVLPDEQDSQPSQVRQKSSIMLQQQLQHIPMSAKLRTNSEFNFNHHISNALELPSSTLQKNTLKRHDSPLLLVNSQVSPQKSDKETQTSCQLKKNHDERHSKLQICDEKQNKISKNQAKTQTNWEMNHLVRKKKYVPSNREELLQLQRKLVQDGSSGCELNRFKKREAKVLRKRLNPQQRREFTDSWDYVEEDCDIDAELTKETEDQKMFHFKQSTSRAKKHKTASSHSIENSFSRGNGQPPSTITQQKHLTSIFKRPYSPMHSSTALKMARSNPDTNEQVQSNSQRHQGSQQHN